jgi:transposase
MEYGAIDLHSRRSQIRIVAADGAVVVERRIDTTRTAFTQLFGDRPRMPILIEASTEAEWVAQCLEGLGHEVIIADPNFALMYGQRSRKVKTDKRDAAALAEACRLGIFRRAHRVSAAQARERQHQAIRLQLIRQRTAVINLLRATLRREGYRLPGGRPDRLGPRLDHLTLPAALAAVLAPLRATASHLTQLIATMNDAAEVRAAADPVVTRLMSVPGVGPIVALQFRAVLDDPHRFGGDARRVAAFVGLVPSEDSSAERRHKGRITKVGPSHLRSLLIQASWAIWRNRRSDTVALRRWATALAERRGKRIAIVALARRLARILYALWRDGSRFTPVRHAVAA